MTASALHVIDRPRQASIALQPIRRRILAELGTPDSAAGLGRRLGISRQKLNYHLRQLESAGLVEAVGERKQRNCTERLLRAVATSYVISPAALSDLAHDPADLQDGASSAYLVASAARAVREVAHQRDGAARAGKKLATLTLSVDVRFPNAERQGEFARELSQLVARLALKYNDHTARRGRRFRVLAAAWPVPTTQDVIPEGQA